MSAERSLKGAEAIFIALLTIGLMGLLFLIIYGNLSGNLGWTPTSTVAVNESLNLSTSGRILTKAVGKVDGVLSGVLVENHTHALTVVAAGNYTIVATTVNASADTVEYFNDIVNISYTVSYDGTSEIQSEAVIANLTGGATQFFTFSNVWFILTAITILIGIVLGVIALVRKASGGESGGGSSKATQFAS
ncbi:hypothetical protein LCGC14_0962260 [marine sediment metagenome]|uniref:Uncharacterized protein n=1 Tax=marine sediment metagenome TaxID=412755 RepID=A0A0F9RKS0_9ZZZZ